ncbi:hypothetical protein K432DRAFT_164769 [Lepidopterella palustris CBS 459.81]|uniref:Uncharacterized protein n=1 Tax=Lepidopterella palustris CBS 459.81 TaxID=1314670 RepID=A0A8E2EHC0_9PEZI|nr:hypothetical protein K432DRAFT_164769 [Lepidopterella palustris CBS 459.81]
MTRHDHNQRTILPHGTHRCLELRIFYLDGYSARFLLPFSHLIFSPFLNQELYLVSVVVNSGVPELLFLPSCHSSAWLLSILPFLILLCSYFSRMLQTRFKARARGKGREDSMVYARCAGRIIP